MAPAASDAPERIGRYVVFRAFARGGVASVHMGRLEGASGFARLVAVKRLHPMFATSEEHVRMLLDEARITSRIRHPNVVPILDVVREGDDLCLVMDYVAGVSLRELAASAKEMGRSIPHDVGVAIVVDLLRGLHAAHEAKAEDGAPLGVVHRDVSPHNVLVGADGVARVLDFGVAKALAKEHLTVTGEVKGKLAYMAPEQLRGEGVTRQSDVFAAGVVLWETLTGERIRGDKEPVAAMAAPRPPGASAALDAITLRALSTEPRDRFATAEEMAVALADACAPATPEEVARFVAYVAMDELERRVAMAREAERWSSPRAPEKERRKPNVLVLGLLGIGVTASVGFLVTASRGPAPVASAVASASPPSPPAASSVVEETPPLPVISASSPPPAAPKPRSGKPRAPGPDCDPPFTIDERGGKHYKPECFTR